MSAFTVYWVRLGFPHVFEPRPITQNGMEIGEPRYSANLHFPENPDPAQVQKIQQAVMEAYTTKWPDPAKRPPLAVSVGCDPRLWVDAPGYIRLPLVWGPAAFPNDPNATGWVLKCMAKADSPPFVGEQVNGITTEIKDRAKAYPGAEVHANIAFFAYDMSAQSRGVSCGLNGVILTSRETPRFDSRPTVGQMFGALPQGAPPPVPGAGVAPPAMGAPPGQGAFAAPATPQQGPFGTPPVNPNPFG